MQRKTEITPASGPAVPETAEARRGDVAAFLAKAAAYPRRTDVGRGRLIFALDATMSRQPTWDAACHLQGEMFTAADRAGGLSVQLVYFRGHGEARSSRWVSDSAGLRKLMTGIACHGGFTQIGRVLDHSLRETKRTPVAALVYVGDAMEENVDALCQTAGALGLCGTRAFLFLEGRDPAAERAFREIARLTGGAMLPFDRSAAGELAALLGAVAAYAAGGRLALEAQGTTAARRVLADLRP